MRCPCRAEVEWEFGIDIFLLVPFSTLSSPPLPNSQRSAVMPMDSYMLTGLVTVWITKLQFSWLSVSPIGGRHCFIGYCHDEQSLRTIAVSLGWLAGCLRDGRTRRQGGMKLHLPICLLIVRELVIETSARTNYITNTRDAQASLGTLDRCPRCDDCPSVSIVGDAQQCNDDID